MQNILQIQTLLHKKEITILTAYYKKNNHGFPKEIFSYISHSKIPIISWRPCNIRHSLIFVDLKSCSLKYLKNILQKLHNHANLSYAKLMTLKSTLRFQIFLSQQRMEVTCQNYGASILMCSEYYWTVPTLPEVGILRGFLSLNRHKYARDILE